MFVSLSTIMERGQKQAKAPPPRLQTNGGYKKRIRTRIFAQWYSFLIAGYGYSMLVQVSLEDCKIHILSLITKCQLQTANYKLQYTDCWIQILKTENNMHFA